MKPIHNMARVLALIVMSMAATAHADTNTPLLQQAEQAFYHGDVQRLENLASEATGIDQLVIRYRQAGPLLSTGDLVRTGDHLQSLLADLEILAGADPDNAEVWVLISAVYGLQVAVSPGMAGNYGPASVGAQARALTLDSNNPMVLMLAGINTFYTPKEWGGGAELAQSYFNRAITAYDSGSQTRVWGEPDAHLWRAQVFSRMDNTAAAKQDLQKALALQPDFMMARQMLDNS